MDIAMKGRMEVAAHDCVDDILRVSLQLVWVWLGVRAIILNAKDNPSSAVVA